MYLKKVTKFGNRIEVEKYHTSRYGHAGEKRRKKQKPSEETVKAANERHAIRKLYQLMCENFTDRDHHIVLTYAKDCLPEVELSKAFLKNFLDRARRAYKAMGIELKWIATTEWERERIHHHLVINNCPDFDAVMRDLWPHGGTHPEALWKDCDYKGLAEYFVKETSRTFRKEENPYKKRYSCSRNLKKPEVTVEVIKADEWRKRPTVSKSQEAAGYVLEEDSIVRDVDIFGFPFLRYTMIRKEKRSEKQVYKRREKREGLYGQGKADGSPGESKKAEAGRNGDHGSSKGNSL